LRGGRFKRAYARLAPSARNPGSVPTVKFEKVHVTSGEYAIRDVKSFGTYWSSFFRSSGQQTRNTQVRKCKVVETIDENTVVVEADVRLNSYPQMVILGFLIIGIFIFVVIMLLQKRETVPLRKLLVYDDGRWYIAEGEFQGAADGAVEA